MAVRCKLGGVLAAIRSQRAPPFQPKFLSKPTLFIQNQVHFCTRMEFWRGTSENRQLLEWVHKLLDAKKQTQEITAESPHWRLGSLSLPLKLAAKGRQIAVSPLN
jgi:hypothetical protein